MRRVAVIGGGRSGTQAALEAAGRGEQVVLVDDQPARGNHHGYQVLQPASCFGLYEGNLPHGTTRYEIGGRPMSASRLERFARCPHQAFLEEPHR